MERARIREAAHLMDKIDETFLYPSGPLIDFNLIKSDTGQCKAGTNPNHFLMPYSKTDRKCNATSFGQLDVCFTYTVLLVALEYVVIEYQPLSRPNMLTYF